MPSKRSDASSDTLNVLIEFDPALTTYSRLLFGLRTTEPWEKERIHRAADADAAGLELADLGEGAVVVARERNDRVPRRGIGGDVHSSDRVPAAKVVQIRRGRDRSRGEAWLRRRVIPARSQPDGAESRDARYIPLHQSNLL